MKPYYEKSWGWNADEKRREMFSPESRYILVKDHADDNYIIAYSHIQVY